MASGWSARSEREQFPLTEIVVIPCPSCLPSNTRASLCVKRGEDTLMATRMILFPSDALFN